MPDDKKLKAFLSSITRKLGGNANALLKAFALRLYEDAHLDDLQEFDAGALAEGAKDSLDFFNIPEDEHGSHFLVDTKTRTS